MRPLFSLLLTGCTWLSSLVTPPEPTPLVVFAVLDTVRADHTNLCGYPRPTTPYLASLVRSGASHTCGGYAPASWTIPSHASMFTGSVVTDHHYDSATTPDWSDRDTLTEVLRAKGYQTMMVTANPVLERAQLLQQGFDVVRAAENLGDWRANDVANELEQALLERDPDKPLMLFINIMDAHDPYMEIPDNIGWVPRRAAMAFGVRDPERSQPYHRFIDGRLRKPQREKFLRVLRDLYDYGVFRADHALREVLEVIEDQQLDADGMRLLITSDHGEFLGEFHRLRHGGSVREPVTRVPFVYLDTTRETQPSFPETAFSTVHAYDLLTTGELPDPLRRAVAFSSGTQAPYHPGHNMVAMWMDDHQKLVWDRGLMSRYDIRKDREELEPLGIWRNPRIGEFQGWVEDYQDHLSWRQTERRDENTREALEELGYVGE
jgi:arylsulfatase A-like enzyme